MATLEQLQSKIQKLQQQADALLARKTQAVVGQIRDLMEAHGLTMADIEARVRGKEKNTNSKSKLKSTAVAKAGLPAKYLNGKTGETWSGRGRPPAWISEAKNRSRFLVDSESTDATTTGVGKAKAAPKVKAARPPVPPKYRDPDSGTTWSGRGTAPSWIAAATDRSKFLIEPTA